MNKDKETGTETVTIVRYFSESYAINTFKHSSELFNHMINEALEGSTISHNMDNGLEIINKDRAAEIFSIVGNRLKGLSLEGLLFMLVHVLRKGSTRTMTKVSLIADYNNCDEYIGARLAQTPVFDIFKKSRKLLNMIKIFGIGRSFTEPHDSTSKRNCIRAAILSTIFVKTIAELKCNVKLTCEMKTLFDIYMVLMNDEGYAPAIIQARMDVVPHEDESGIGMVIENIFSKDMSKYFG